MHAHVNTHIYVYSISVCIYPLPTECSLCFTALKIFIFSLTSTLSFKKQKSQSLQRRVHCRFWKSRVCFLLPSLKDLSLIKGLGNHDNVYWLHRPWIWVHFPIFKHCPFCPFPVKGNCRLQMEVCNASPREDHVEIQETGPGSKRHYFLSPSPLALHDSAGLREWQRSYSADGAQAAKAVAWVPEIMDKCACKTSSHTMPGAMGLPPSCDVTGRLKTEGVRESSGQKSGQPTTCHHHN